MYCYIGVNSADIHKMLNHLDTTSVDMDAINIQCDRCSARFRFRVVFLQGEMAYKELLFCGHHMNKYYEALAELSVWIVDDNEPPF